AVLGRFDSEVGDLVNGMPPALSDLASRLGVDRSKLVSALKAAEIDQVERARSRGFITKAQAGAIERHIRTSPGVPLGGIGFCIGLRDRVGSHVAFAGPRLRFPGARFGGGG